MTIWVYWIRWWLGTSFFLMTQRAIDGPYIYFVTTNATYRARIFDSADTAKILGAIITSACKEFQFILYGYCILPDHMHLLVEKSGMATLSILMKHIKGRFWQVYNKGSGLRLWQPRFNFRIIESVDRFNNTVEYIQYNYIKVSLSDQYGKAPFVCINWRVIHDAL